MVNEKPWYQMSIEHDKYAKVLKFISLILWQFNSKLSHNNTIEWLIKVRIVLKLNESAVYENGFHRIINDSAIYGIIIM